MFGQPQRTAYDLNFSLFGIPVRVHPFFWLSAVLLGSSNPEPLSLLIWTCVLFVSILVHELGHAFVIRYYGWTPEITLLAFGGQASYNPGFAPFGISYNRRGNTPLGQILISLAGPGAGFLFAGAVVLGLFVAGRQITLFGIPLGSGVPIVEPRLYLLVINLLFINIFWGLINLFPIYPLDGGKIGREVLVAVNPREGVRQSLILSMCTGIGLAIAGFVYLGSFYVALLFGYLAFQSYQMLQAPGGFGGGGFGGKGGGRPW